MKKTLSIRGNVFELLEEGGKIIAKVSYSPGIISVPINESLEIHLNDEIIIKGNFEPSNISLAVSEDIDEKF